MVQHKKRVMIVIAVILLLGMLGTSLTSYFVSRDAIRKQLSDSTLPLVGNTIYSEIQRDLLRPVFISSLMASNTFVHDWVSNGELNVDQISRYLKEVQVEFGAFTAFFASESTRHYYHPSGLLKTMNVADPRDAWFFKFREKAEHFELNVDEDTANRDEIAVFVNFRVVDENEKFLGAIGVGLAIESVSEIIDNYSKTFSRIIYFVDKNGDIQLGAKPHGAADSILSVDGLDDISPQILDEKQFTDHYSSAEGEVFLNSRFIEELGWYLMVEQRESGMLAPVTRTLLYNLLSSLVIALLVLCVARRVFFPYHRELENRAQLDELTGAYNRRAFEVYTEEAIETSVRKNQSLSMLFLDIDHFKSINDKHGHLVGDLAIKHIVETIKKNVRASDYVCRWGGEEFCVLLQQCGSRESYQVAQAVLASVAEQPLIYEDLSLNMTVSIGVAKRFEDEPTSQLLQRLDNALYKAKNSGRNQVQLAGSLNEPAKPEGIRKRVTVID